MIWPLGVLTSSLLWSYLTNPMVMLINTPSLILSFEHTLTGSTSQLLNSLSPRSLRPTGLFRPLPPPTLCQVISIFMSSVFSPCSLRDIIIPFIGPGLSYPSQALLSQASKNAFIQPPPFLHLYLENCWLEEIIQIL